MTDKRWNIRRGSLPTGTVCRFGEYSGPRGDRSDLPRNPAGTGGATGV